MRFIKNDGGRDKYFPTQFKKDLASDCVVRAIAIALDIDYKVVWDCLFEYGQKIGHLPNDKRVYEPLLLEHGWTKNSPLKKGNKKYKVKNLPVYNAIIHTTNHLTAVVDGNLHDNWDCREWKANSFYLKGE